MYFAVRKIWVFSCVCLEVSNAQGCSTCWSLDWFCFRDRTEEGSGSFLMDLLRVFPVGSQLGHWECVI